jgi:hypothetical protein
MAGKTPAPAQTEPVEVEVRKAAPPQTYAEYMAQLTGRTGGADKVDDKDALIGVPFVITKVQFRIGDVEEKLVSDYAKVFIMTADDEQLMIVDGSKGVRRQVVQLLAGMGLIEVDDPDDPFQVWKGSDNKEKLEFTHTADGRPLAVLCKKGLRKSKNPDAPASHSSTYFIA